jgi:putative tricarboxylic transport membrane protein
MRALATLLPGARAATLALGLTLGLGAAAQAQGLENLTIVAPAKPGGGWDQTARALQAVMQADGIAQTVTVENVAGAGGTVGLAQFVDQRAGQGDALLVGGLVMVGAILTNGSPVTLAQVTPIARLTGEYEVLVVPADSPITSMADLLAAFKADPGAVSWGGGSAGGTDHILAGLIAQAAGLDPTLVNYIPYSGGGEALAGILGGHVTVGVSGYGEWAGQIASGELRALAISSGERVAGLEIPTLKEQGLDVELANWRAVMAPPDISPEARQALLDAVDRTVKSPAWQATLKERDWLDTYLAGDDFAAFLQAEDTRVTATLKAIGLVP